MTRMPRSVRVRVTFPVTRLSHPSPVISVESFTSYSLVEPSPALSCWETFISKMFNASSEIGHTITAYYNLTRGISVKPNLYWVMDNLKLAIRVYLSSTYLEG